MERLAGRYAPCFPSHACGAGTLAGARAAGAAPAREPIVPVPASPTVPEGVAAV
jgi:hypothetical protein